MHEVRDPIHVFIHYDGDERRVIDSAAFQRLRHIHQLALSFMVYPGATHRRFEHSLGVMDLAGRIFKVVTSPDALTDTIRTALPEITEEKTLDYWHRVLRMAALCHDLGHLPFSHAAEHDLLPAGWDHERLTREIVLSADMRSIWNAMTPPLRPEDIVKLALGPRKAKDLTFTTWETVLSEMIIGDAFGADRMDYLLRDSYHAGVAYGRFDHNRLIDALRILPAPQADGAPSLGVHEGGLHSAEALLLARYFMYTQVYFHHVRRVYDIHLCDFLKEWLPGGRFPIRPSQLLNITDNNVLVAMSESARKPSKRGHNAAKRILTRTHFRRLYQRYPGDVLVNPEASRLVFEAAKGKFGLDAVRYDIYASKGGLPDFPVRTSDGRIVSSLSVSETLQRLPVVATEYVFVEPSLRDKARQWLEDNRESIVVQARED